MSSLITWKSNALAVAAVCASFYYLLQSMTTLGTCNSNLVAGALICVSCYYLLHRKKKIGATTSNDPLILDDDTEMMFPSTKNIKDISSDIRNEHSLHVSLLSFEIMFGGGPLANSSYTSRVFRLSQCDEADVERLKESFANVLSGYPILAGRIQNGAVVLPFACFRNIGTNDIKSASAISASYGVPFRVVKHSNEVEPPNEHLEPVDVARFSTVYEPKDVLSGRGPVMSICIHRFNTGAATIAISVTHTVMDGFSLSTLVSEWAKMNRNLLAATALASQEKEPTTLPSILPLVPVSRNLVPSPFDDMEEFKAAQVEFLGEVIDSGERPTIMDHLKRKVMMAMFSLSGNKDFFSLKHPVLHRDVVNIPKELAASIKRRASPPKPDWISTSDAIGATLLQALVKAKEEKSGKKCRQARVTLLLQSRPYLKVPSNLCYGVGLLLWNAATLEDPANLSLDQIALSIRKGLEELTEEKALRYWRMICTIFERKVGLMKFMARQRNADVSLALNNLSKFPLPDFGLKGEVTSVSTQAGPTVILPTKDGGCRLFVHHEYKDLLAKSDLLQIFSN